MDRHQHGITRVLVGGGSSGYELDEYLTSTHDIEEFRRQAAPCSRVTPVSEGEYERLLHDDDPEDERIFRCLSRCFRCEGLSIHSLDREATGRIMRVVREALGYADTDE